MSYGWSVVRLKEMQSLILDSKISRSPLDVRRCLIRSISPPSFLCSGEASLACNSSLSMVRILELDVMSTLGRPKSDKGFPEIIFIS
jgi:hypothetical protein